MSIIAISRPWPVLRRRRDEVTRANSQDEIEQAVARQRRRSIAEANKEAVLAAYVFGGGAVLLIAAEAARETCQESLVVSYAPVALVALTLLAVAVALSP